MEDLKLAYLVQRLCSVPDNVVATNDRSCIAGVERLQFLQGTLYLLEKLILGKFSSSNIGKKVTMTYTSLNSLTLEQ